MKVVNKLNKDKLPQLASPRGRPAAAATVGAGNVGGLETSLALLTQAVRTGVEAYAQVVSMSLACFSQQLIFFAERCDFARLAR